MIAIAGLTLTISHGSIPYYQQLREQILSAIREQRVLPNEKLPSSRNLAKMLGVSRSVVTQTYDQLIAEGVLISLPKRGVFIASASITTEPAKLEPRFVSIDTKPTLEYFDSSADYRLFPHRDWAASMRRAWLNPDPNVLMGNYGLGLPQLKQQLANFLFSLRGLECDADQIVITAGNRDALQLLQHILKDRVSRWYTEDPTYPPINESLSGSKGLLPMQESGSNPPDVEEVWAAVLTPCRQYPLGFSYSAQYREKWLTALSEEQGFVVEDDYDNEFIYQGKPATTLFQAAKFRAKAENRIFYVGSFSKTMFRGLRLSYLVVPKEFINQAHYSQRQLGQSASLPMQPALSDFIESGTFYRHLNRMRRHYRVKRDLLDSLLTTYLSKWFEWEKPTGGMHILTKLKPPCATDTHVCRNLKQYALSHHLKLSLLEEHYAESDTAPRGIVFGFSNTTEENMECWVRLIRNWLLQYDNAVLKANPFVG